MKKKLTAILLTLCMVLGMLPMSALAAWYKGDSEVTWGEPTDNNQYYSFDVDSQTYYIKGSTVPGKADTLDYYKYYSTGYEFAGTLTWKDNDPTHAEVESVSISGTAKEGQTLTAT